MKVSSFWTKLVVWGSVALSTLTAGTVTLSVTGAAKITNPELRYLCRFYNYDNTFLFSCGVSPSHEAVYNGPMPERQDSLYSEYLFKGWDNSLENITSDMDFHALYQEKKKDYLVTFVNYDGSALYEYYVEAGGYPHYGGETPTKEINDSFTYTFVGWDKSFTAIYENTVYTAEFERAEVFVNTTFLNYDGEVLYKGRVPYNGVAAYNAPNPTRESTSVVKYKFTGWDKSLFGIIEDTVFTAQYEEEIPTYTVTFVNYDGTFLCDDVVNYYESATFSGPTPHREAEGNFVYNFTGWDKTFDCVIEDMVVTAQFESSIPQFTVTFKNYDLSTLGSDTVEIGGTVEYHGETPQKPDDDAHTYRFIGWDRPLTNVKSSFYTVALYEELPKVHTVTFKNYDGTVLDVDEVNHGEAADYGGGLPTKPFDIHYAYHFKGWDKDISCVLEDMEVFAEYSLENIESSTIYPHGNSGAGPSSSSHSSSTSYPEPYKPEHIDDDETLWYVTRFLNHDLTEIKQDITSADQEPFFDMNAYGSKLVREDSKHPEYNFTFQDFTEAFWNEETQTSLKDDRVYRHYIAQYTLEVNSKQYYSVCFRNDDEHVLKEYFLQYGEVPHFPDDFVPQPKSLYFSGYVFDGWDKEIKPVTKSVTYFAKYRQETPITNGNIPVNNSSSVSLDRPILSYTTPYNGNVYFREMSYANYMNDEDRQNFFGVFQPYNIETERLENQISPLEFTSNKLKQLDGVSHYSMNIDVSSEYRNYFAMHPSYLYDSNNLSKSDAYLIGNNETHFNYSYMPLEIDMATVQMLKAISFSNSKYSDQEFIYRTYAKERYTSISDKTLSNFIDIFIDSYDLEGSTIKQIFDVKNFLNSYASYQKGYKDFNYKRNAIINFLESENPIGDSAHFAAALTCIYRRLGVPARFVTGARSEAMSGVTNVLYTNDLSAWTEVYIDGVGWIIMDASINASGGDLPPAHTNIYNPFGEVDPERKLMTITVKPLQYVKSYDGLKMGITYETSGTLIGEDRLVLRTLPGASNVGRFVTRAYPRIFNEFDEDVTSAYIGRIEMVYEEYEIEKATLKITTGSATRKFNGKELTCHEYTVTNIAGALAYDDTINFEFTGSQTKRGSSPNYVNLDSLTITSSTGDDVLNNYKVIWEYGRLSVT